MQIVNAFLTGFGPPITPYTDTFSSPGSSSVAIPYGARQAVIKVSGAGGGGAVVNDFGSETGGGASGAYVVKTVMFAAADAGQSINYTVPSGGAGAAFNPSVEIAGSTGGTATVTATLTDTTINISAGGGQGGRTNNTASTGGTASGGDTNTNGNDGATSSGASAPSGATGVGGNAGFVDDAEGEDGSDGQVVIEWS